MADVDICYLPFETIQICVCVCVCCAKYVNNVQWKSSHKILETLRFKGSG